MKHRIMLPVFCIMSAFFVFAMAGSVGTMRGIFFAKAGSAHVVNAPVSGIDDASDASDSVNNRLPDRDFVENLLNMNHLYGEFIFDDDSLVEEACASLSDRAISYRDYLIIDKESVDRFITDLYGRTVADNAGVKPEFPAPDGYYAVVPHESTPISHTVTGIRRDESGSIIVTSKMYIGLGETSTVNVVSVLREDSRSQYQFVIISSVILEDILPNAVL